jgi:hypothetical protein
MVVCKAWAIKPPALAWTSSEVSNEDYGNSADSMLVKLNDHDICCDLEDEFQIAENSGEGAIGMYVNFKDDDPSDAVYVYDMSEKTNANPDLAATEHALVALNPGCVLNSVNPVTLSNRAVLLPIHQVVYDALTADAETLIGNSLNWAANRLSCGSAVEDIKTEIATIVYPNPSSGMVNLDFNQFVTSAEITIMSVDGRTMRSLLINNVDFTSLDLSDLNSGIYIIKIAGNNINYKQSICLQ